MKLPFLLTTLAGISTLIGFLFIYVKGKKEKIIASSLSFAAGVMITLSIFDLIPEALKEIRYFNSFFPSFLIALIGINLGIIISSNLEKKVKKSSNSSLYKIGLTSMLAIVLHNIPEGIATYLTSTNNIKLGIKLTLAIALHNIPEGIAIAIPIYYSTNSKNKSFIYTLISGLSEIVGAVLAFLFLKDIMNSLYMGFLYSVVAGIMLTLSIKELIIEALKKETLKSNLIFYIIGSILMIISIILI